MSKYKELTLQERIDLREILAQGEVSSYIRNEEKITELLKNVKIR